MYISKIRLQNYRGIKEAREINLSRFSSIVGKNDAGKSIVLNAIATFLDIKSFSVTSTDFNLIKQPILFQFTFTNDDIKELLATKIKSKVKKSEGLDEFVSDFIFDNNNIIYRRRIDNVGKSWSKEAILLNDFEREDLRGLYFKADEELTDIIKVNNIQIPIDGKRINSKIEKIKYNKSHFETEL